MILPNSRKTLAAAAVLGTLAVTPTAMAHHGWGSYDSTTLTTLEGTVQSVSFSNPHASAQLEAQGKVWTIVLARAFGPGPMTGSLAILLTDTGSFGKLFSEALENIDEKQVEGVRSTGANRLQRARFGVIPQVTPVLLSQVLYFLESNTRGATVIGAIVGGGIGLLLTQAIQTQKDWEDVAYYMVLIVLTVIAMDSLSGWLRRKLIKGT